MTTPPPRQVELNDGRLVPNDSREWLEECLGRAQHVRQLWGMARGSREAYIASIKRLEGERAAERLKARFIVEFEQTKAGGA